MRIDDEFTVGAPLEQAWAVLTDLEGIAPCMPGAVLTGREGDIYSGKVKIKVGPVTSEYAGTAMFVEKDDAAHHAVIDAKGRDSRGAGNASAVITADLAADGADGTTTKVTVSTDLKITGRIAQFGSGMINEVSRKLLGQFVDCLENKLAVSPPPPTSAAGADATAEPTPAPELTPAAEPRRAPEPTPEPQALDVLALSRGAVAKRLVPLLAGVVVVAVVIYLLVR